jgi:hypothetical protein
MLWVAPIAGGRLACSGAFLLNTEAKENKRNYIMECKPFSMGQLVGTPAALAILDSGRIAEILQRHLNFDWGTVGVSDWRANDLATLDGGRIFSAYWIDEQDHEKGKVWVITTATDDDGARESTCILLPEDY